MPVEERLRNALADQAASVHADVEAPLALVHRRRGRATAWKAAAAAAAVIAVTAGATAVLGTEPGRRPAPATPPDTPTEAPVEPIPTGTYSRPVSVDEARDAGLPRSEVRQLFDGGEQVQALMEFRDQRHLPSGGNSWFVRFVDVDGERLVRDGGSYYYDGADLTIVSEWIECLGCNYHFTYEVDHGRLSLATTPETQPYLMAALIEGGTWQRVRD